jgi:hypothetical protein
MVNPYAVRLVIKDPEAFYGRSAEVSDLFTRLSAMQSCSVVGPRRIGKSSLLYHLTQVYHQHLPDADNYVFAFIDLQELSGLGMNDFFDTAVFQLQEASDHSVLAEMDIDRYGDMRGFRRFLLKLRGTGLKLVLCLDEFEMLSENENYSVDFFTYLRGLCSNYDLALITSSRASLYELCHQGGLQTSQFWNIFVELSLSLMPEEEALSLICDPFSKTGRELTMEEIAFVQAWAGRHPIFIQTCCYHLFNTPLAEVAPRYMAEAEPHFIYAYRRFTADQQSAVHQLAANQPITLSESEFVAMQKQAVVQGTANQPRLVSRGWQQFLTQRPSDLASDQSQKSEPKSIDLPQMRNLMLRHFDENELEDLCFDLRVDYEQLAGDEKRKKTRSLINKMERENRLPELIDLCTQIRPHVDWSDTS